MRNLVSTYVDQFRQDRQKQIKLAAILAALAVVVAGVVFWQLHNTGVAMTNEVFCGQEEHVHDDGCYEQVLICDNEEEDHVHDDSCYETVLTCQIPEHTHTIECMTDDTADVETADVWEATLPALSGNWSEDVAAIAESQLGYTESTANFVLADDGETHMGYTRYGAWYGNAYGDWDAMFASFCLNYANVPASVVAESSGAYALAASLDQTGLYIDSADFTPAAGDLVFFDENGNGQADRVGIIVNAGDNELTVVEGNSEDAVAENTYDMNDSGILAFGILPDQGTPDGTENIDGDLVYAADDGGVYVSVTAPADALPEGAELSVTLIDEDSTDYAEAADAIGLNVQTLSSDEEEAGMAVLDICFLKDGVEVEPAEPVTVSIDAGAILPDGAENIVIRHLEETDTGVVPVLMAELNNANPVAEFEVESFSSFTVTWTIENGPASGTTYSVTVYAYLDGNELNDIDRLTFNSENDELNLEDLLKEVEYGSGDYTFSYATVTYTTATTGPGGGTTETTLGSQDNPVVAIEIESGGAGGGGGSSNFVIVFADGTTTTVATSNNVTVRAYYTTPDFTVEIESVDTDELEDWLLQAVISHAGTYDHIEYDWTITNNDRSSNTYATIGFSDTTGRVFIKWAEDVADNTEITVSVTATLYDANDTVIDTATGSYVLEYGDETIDLIMTYGPDNTALPAGVEVTVSNDSHTYTGITDENGWVNDLEIEPGIYTITATYTVDGATYQCSKEVALHDAGNYSVNLDFYDPDILANVTDRDNWEHIDIKLSVGTTSTDASNENVSIALTGVVIYETYDPVTGTGTVRYTATADSIEGNDNEFNCTFYEGENTTGTPSHSISFSTSDTIKISYTLTWTSDDDPDYERTEEYTIIIDSSTTYSEGTTYPATGQRAYKLYNYLYGTEYSSDAQLQAAGIEEVDIGGMSMMLVASILCDSSEVTGAGQVQAASGTGNQWGMDFAVSIDTFIELSTNWMFDIEKTYVNHALTDEEFTFYMYSADFDDYTGYWNIEDENDGGWHYTLTNSTAGLGIDGNASDTINNVYITFDDSIIQRNETHYYIICEDIGNENYTYYDGTVFGAAVFVGIDNDPGSETYGQAIVSATYYILTLNEDGVTYTATQYEGDKITLDDDYPTFHFTNTYQTDIMIWKQNMSDGYLSDAEFTLTQKVNAFDDDGNELSDTYDYYYYDHSKAGSDDPNDDVWVKYDPDDASTIPEGGFPTFVLGNIELLTPRDGEYTFSEVKAPTGYATLPGDIVVTIEEGLLVSAEWADPSLNDYYNIDDYVTIDSANLNLVIKDENAEFDVSIFKYTGDVIWTSEDVSEGSYYILYTDDDETVWYAIVGQDTDPIDVTEWTTNQEFASVIVVDSSTEEQYYFTGRLGNDVVLTNIDSGVSYELSLVNDSYQALAGAEFILQDENGNYAVLTQDQTTSIYRVTGWTEDINEATTVLVSSSDGYIYISGMTFGTYTLTEMKAPDGYNMLTESVEFTIETDGEVDSQIVVGNSVGVVNTPGSQLPNTGGVGTWIYTATGLLLIGGAASLLVYRKRRAV